MNHSHQGIIRIGTSGIVVPGTKLTFPDEFQTGSRLHYYGSLFNTLEINSSFYKIPQAKTFAKWAIEVPNDFRFTVKCWRGITHAKQLNFSMADIDLFMTAIASLGEKAGCLLIQFPASIRFQHIQKVEKILARITEKNSNEQWKLAVELRHTSWYCDAAYTMFQKYSAAVVMHDMPGSVTPSEAPISNLIYRRFHGPTGNYNGSYSDDLIHSYAEEINNWRNTINNIYIYFNNTMGSALQNAQLLQKLTSTP